MIDLGDPVTLAMYVKDLDTGLPADATGVTGIITLPDLTTVALSGISHPATGTYQATYTPTMAGAHQVVWTATGANAGVYSETFDVAAAEPAPILSLTEARDLLGVGIDPDRDERIRDDIRAATTLMEDHAGRVYRRRTVVDTYSFPRGATILLRKTPAAAVTSVVDNGTTLAATAYHVDAFVGAVTSLTGGWTGPDVVITYTAGDTVIGNEVLSVARDVLRALWTRRSGASGSPRRAAGADPSELTIAAALARLRREHGFA